MSKVNISEDVLNFEKHINDSIVGNYKKLIEKRDAFKSMQDEYISLKDTLQNITDLNLSSLTTRIDLGQLTYCSAHIPDTSKVIILVSLGIFMEFTIPEALIFLDKKINHLQEDIDRLSETIARSKVNIISASQQLGKLLNI